MIGLCKRPATDRQLSSSPACSIPFLHLGVRQDWNLLRVWDAMEFEEEHNESVTMGLDAEGGLDPSQTKVLL